MSGVAYNPNSDQFDLWKLSQPSSVSTHSKSVGFSGASTGDWRRNEMMQSLPSTQLMQSKLYMVNKSPPIEQSLSPFSNAINSMNAMINLIAENVLSHPFIVLRTLCQVNRKSKAYHLTPVTVIPLIIHIQHKQGLTVLWKGVASVLITKGILIACEAFISEFTSFPRDANSKKLTLEGMLKHLILKGTAIIIITPFLCSSCIEIVQSSITNENPSVLDFIKEGIARSIHWKIERKLPIWMLIGPTVAYHLTHYIFSNCFRNISLYFKTQNSKEIDEKNCNKQYEELMSSLWGTIIADIMLYPLQTIIFRLYIQGTRTIIDNVDQSSAVIPVISNYDSCFDCYSTIIKEEGKMGLFKGFGALILQYAVQYSIIRLTKCFVLKLIPNLSN